MPSLMHVFIAVYLLNLVPAFAPPTWMAMSWLGLHDPSAAWAWVALVGAVAATLGRMTLARGSRWLVRQRILSRAARENIDTIKDQLAAHRALSVGILLFYAFSPLPSNFLFIAYGLSAAPIWVVALPFFVGRFVSYCGWIMLGQTAAIHVVGNGDTAHYLGGYFIVSQLLVLAALYVFVKLDWVTLFAQRRLRWRKVTPVQRPPAAQADPPPESDRHS